MDKRLFGQSKTGSNFVINGINSDKKSISSGVLQGSVVGLILFLAYINDLSEQVKSRVRLFADDTTLSGLQIFLKIGGPK